MDVYFGTDHAGFPLKNVLLKYVRDELHHSVHDCGAYAFDESDDYPDFITPTAIEVARDKASRGIVIGGSGQGEAIAANRVAHIRAAVYYGGDLSIVRLAREHNDANILSLGARFLSTEEAKEAVKIWLDTPFTHEPRHIRRIEKIES